jgi:hypothetical protein
MRRDLSASLRNLVAAPALALTKPIVEPSDPLVEGVLVESDAGRAVVLMNWAYRATGERTAEIQPLQDLSVLMRGAGPVTEATSVYCGDLKPTKRGDDVVVSLPTLAEGDVVLLK